MKYNKIKLNIVQYNKNYFELNAKILGKRK